MLRILLLASVSCALGVEARADTYDCRVEHKIQGEHVYPEENLETYRPRVVVHKMEGGAQISRCSISPSAEGEETCDEYAVDRIVVDGRVGISKYYYFEGQLDVQIWADGYFVENNGRASVSFGRCTYSPLG